MVVPEPINGTVAAIDRYHESKPRRRSRRLGASLAGEPCARRMWYSFRWAAQEEFSGRILRLFRRGQLEEGIVLDDLSAIGCKIEHVLQEQLELEIDGHIVGYPDGVITEGVPEAPKKPHLLEIKTRSAKSFAALSKKGVPEKHAAQCQVNMLAAGIDRCLYVAVCKDDDSLFVERIRLDVAEATRITERMKRVVYSPTAPPPISVDPSWYQCKMCPMERVCRKDAAAEKNCRTCAHSTPLESGEWQCERWGKAIPAHVIETGCHAYVPHPDCINGELVSATEWTAVYSVGGVGVEYGVDA